MTIRLIFDSQFVGKVDTTVYVPDDTTDEEIKEEVFPAVMGIKYDCNCNYEIIKTE